MGKRQREYEVACSAAKKNKTNENPNEIQPETSSKHKRKRESGDSSPIPKKQKNRSTTKKRERESGDYPSPIPNKKSKVDQVGNPLSRFPKDVSFMILDELFEPTDHVSFAMVCKDWRSISENYNTATQRWRKKGALLPIFLVSTESELEGNTSNQKVEAYSISRGQMWSNLKFPVTHGKRCCGSSHGWLAIVYRECLSLSITLVHPLQNSVKPIKLPFLDIMRKWQLGRDIDHFMNNYKDYIQKVILSCDPISNPDSYTVAVLYDHVGSKLAFINAGQQQWTYPNRRQSRLQDAIFYRNQVYAVGRRIISFDVNGCKKPSKPPKANTLTREFKDAINSYVVESVKGDHLWYVRRQVRGYKEKFIVYKVVFDEKDGSVVRETEEVESIGDEALFVGTSHSISVLASNFPGCKPNSIYYTTEEPYGFEYHIFSLDDDGFRTITMREYEPSLQTRCRRQCLEIPCGIWMLPMFKGLF